MGASNDEATALFERPYLKKNPSYLAVVLRLRYENPAIVVHTTPV
jgi:hypothetical protein